MIVFMIYDVDIDIQTIRFDPSKIFIQLRLLWLKLKISLIVIVKLN